MPQASGRAILLETFDGVHGDVQLSPSHDTFVSSPWVAKANSTTGSGLKQRKTTPGLKPVINLLVCLPACLPVCLSVCLSVSACLSVSVCLCLCLCLCLLPGRKGTARHRRTQAIKSCLTSSGRALVLA